MCRLYLFIHVFYMCVFIYVMRISLLRLLYSLTFEKLLVITKFADLINCKIGTLCLNIVYRIYVR